MKTFWIILISLILSAIPALLTGTSLVFAYINLSMGPDTYSGSSSLGVIGWAPWIYGLSLIMELIYTAILVFLIKKTTSPDSRFKISFIVWVLIGAIIFGLSFYAFSKRIFGAKSVNTKSSNYTQTKPN